MSTDTTGRVSAALAAVLRAEMGRQNLRQKDVLERLPEGSSASLSRWLKGNTAMSLDVAVTLCRALDLDPIRTLAQAFADAESGLGEGALPQELRGVAAAHAEERERARSSIPERHRNRMVAPVTTD